MKENILGIKINAEPFEELMNRVIARLNTDPPKPMVIACANPHSIINTMKLNDFFQALNNFDLILPDGAGIVLASKILGGSIKKRISGPDFFIEFTKILNSRGGCSYFFLGSTEETLCRIKERMAREFPNIEVVGTYSPPFTKELYFPEEENEKMVEAVNDIKPDILWVGLTAPKQELWIHKNLHRLNVRVIGAIGAAFDFFAGTKKRSPKIFRKLGLEWLPRLIMEPKRMWRRNFVSTPLFIYYVFKERFRRRK